MGHIMLLSNLRGSVFFQIVLIRTCIYLSSPTLYRSEGILSIPGALLFFCALSFSIAGGHFPARLLLVGSCLHSFRRVQKFEKTVSIFDFFLISNNLAILIVT